MLSLLLGVYWECRCFCKINVVSFLCNFYAILPSQHFENLKIVALYVCAILGHSSSLMILFPAFVPTSTISLARPQIVAIRDFLFPPKWRNKLEFSLIFLGVVLEPNDAASLKIRFIWCYSFLSWCNVALAKASWRKMNRKKLRWERFFYMISQQIIKRLMCWYHFSHK